jgi:uncharacterized cupin superfamily protein
MRNSRDRGAPQRYRAGDAFVIEPGFRGVWRVIEAMRKRYVITYRSEG